MVILNVTREVNGWGLLAIVGVLLLGGAAIVYCVTFLSSNVRSFWRWLGLFASAFLIAICIYSVPKNMTNVYELYPNGATIEEISEEYNITSVRGLIVTAYKKEEK